MKLSLVRTIRHMVGLLAFVFLVACGGAPTVEELINDRELLQTTVDDCNYMMAQGKDTNIPKCQNAAEAAERMADNLLKGIFGDAFK